MCNQLVLDNLRWTRDEVEVAQNSEPTLGTVIERVKPGIDRLEGQGPGVRQYVALWDQLELKDNLLYYNWYNTRVKHFAGLLVMPRSLTAEAIKQPMMPQQGGIWVFKRPS